MEITEGYSALDQYVIGLRGPGEIAPFFYVDEPDDFQPNRAFKFSSTPEVGSFTGKLPIGSAPRRASAARFEPYYRKATGGRGEVDSRLP